jgi:eukaryotic-like serine/threonine-protein kinase
MTWHGEPLPAPGSPAPAGGQTGGGLRAPTSSAPAPDVPEPRPPAPAETAPPTRPDTPPDAAPSSATSPAGGPTSPASGPTSPAGRPTSAILPPPAPGSGLAEGQRGAPDTVIGGRYTLRTAIGHGGMGTVWRATDTVLRRDVAVKEVLLPPGLAASDRDAMYQRTLREARAAAALSHPAVVQVYDVVTDAGRPWIVMELLQSRSLAEMIVEDGPLAPRAVAKIGIALLGALEVAHAAGVLHRDVKPANVLISSDGRCVLTDFGVARMPTDAELTSPGMVLGSPHFISPERAVGASFGPPSDLFSLGVTLYTAVEGRPPFDKPDPFETMRAVVEEAPSPAMRAGALAGVLYGLLEKDPQRRWDVNTARSVLRELLVGPLASNPATPFTDPYAVVRPPPYTPPTADTTTGQIGGRAMLAPGETVSAALRRLSATAGQDAETPVSPAPAPAQRRPVELDATSADGLAMPGLDVDVLPVGRRPPAGVTAGQGRGRHAAASDDAGAGFAKAARTAGTAAAQTATSLASRARPLAVRGYRAARRAPRWAQIAGAAAVVVLLVAGVLGIAALFRDDARKTAPPVAQVNPPPSAPPFEVQEHRDQRGFTLNVPKAWAKRVAQSGYVDYVDPTDENRMLRINVENTGRSALVFAEGAENYLKTRNPRCIGAYNRIALREDQKLGGLPAVELEYLCGTGDTARHGIWLFTVQNGKAYHVFLSVPHGQFEQAQPIYREMIGSYRFAA